MFPCISYYIRRRVLVIGWISLVIFLFYDTFTVYNSALRYRHLRNILGTGLCVSRATATVLNLSCALVLPPICKKMNQLLYHALASTWPRLFFFWLEAAKSCHMTLAITIVVFSVIHSATHFVNMWNFSRHYDEDHRELNFAVRKNQYSLKREGVQNPAELLATRPGLTGVSMLLITAAMATSSLRWVRRHHYNLFRHTHQLFVAFMTLLLIHPLSGVLKEEVVGNTEKGEGDIHRNTSSPVEVAAATVFVPIQSKTWVWVSPPLLWWALDALWRHCSRYRADAAILRAYRLPGRALSLRVRSPSPEFRCRPGQYVLLQCPSISRLEWHPFSVTQMPSSSQPYFKLLVRVRGDWTESLEKIIDDSYDACGDTLENTIQMLVDGPYSSPLESMMREEVALCVAAGVGVTPFALLLAALLQMLVDGPYSSPIESMMRDEVALCVAAGVGVTPFASLLAALLQNPRGKYPGRVHMIWIVRQESELSWLAELITKVLLQLRTANRPDRLHVELYVTGGAGAGSRQARVSVDGGGNVRTSLLRSEETSHRAVLSTPVQLRGRDDVDAEGGTVGGRSKRKTEGYDVLSRHPLLGCRVRRSRPRWDSVFGYWLHLYPGRTLSLYCCGPKRLTTELRGHCRNTNQRTNNTINLIHEGFS